MAEAKTNGEDFRAGAVTVSGIRVYPELLKS